MKNDLTMLSNLPQYQKIILVKYFRSLLNDREFIEEIPSSMQDFEDRYGIELLKLIKNKYKLDAVSLDPIKFFGCVLLSMGNIIIFTDFHDNMIKVNSEINKLKKALRRFKDADATDRFFIKEANFYKTKEKNNPMKKVIDLLDDFDKLENLPLMDGSDIFIRHYSISLIGYLTELRFIKFKREATEFSLDFLAMMGYKLGYSLDDWSRILRREEKRTADD